VCAVQGGLLKEGNQPWGRTALPPVSRDVASGCAFPVAPLQLGSCLHAFLAVVPSLVPGKSHWTPRVPMAAAAGGSTRSGHLVAGRASAVVCAGRTAELLGSSYKLFS